MLKGPSVIFPLCGKMPARFYFYFLRARKRAYGSARKGTCYVKNNRKTHHLTEAGNIG
jgi:hypothetical protein